MSKTYTKHDCNSRTGVRRREEQRGKEIGVGGQYLNMLCLGMKVTQGYSVNATENRRGKQKRWSNRRL